jgi:glutaryl-CoA dehydrogenase
MFEYRNLDLLALDELLSDEQRMVRDSVRSFVQRRILPEIEAWAWAERFPTELIPELGALGVLGAPYADFDLPGLDNTAYGLINRELERGDSGLRSFVSVQTSLVMYPILEWGSDEQKTRWIPALGRGDAVGCFGLTEPDFGSNPGGMRTRATRDGDDWVLNGAKMWITNGSIADVAVVWAATDHGVRGFLVERGTPGFSTVDHRGKYSLRCSVTSQLVFDDCRIPDANRLPGTTGLRNALACLNQARFGIAWGALGSGMATFESALDYAASRLQFRERPIASHQMVQAKLVTMFDGLLKGQLLAHRLADLKDAGRLRHEAVSLAKRNNVAVARECARLAREIHGANGIANEYPIMRHLMNMETVVTYEGTEDIHTLVLGTYLTGVPAFNPPER